MSEHHHHHHHHHRRDDASRFKERSLKVIALRRKFEKWLKILMTVIAVLMVCTAIIVYIFG